ncbi:MAG: hypothetical protein EBZ48_07700 [Proteobacteria bacterium]|nr:hypothetical protein [Pseudomonadota bacterium]
MLQTIHKYRKTLIGTTFFLLLAISLSGIGVNSLHNFGEKGRAHAIKVNEQEISFNDFAKIARNSRQAPQAAADRVVAQTLLEQKAKQLGFSAGAGAVAQTLDAEIFRGNFDPQLYRYFLQQLGMSAQEFESTLRTEALRSQLTQLLRDVSYASQKEVRAHVTSELTTVAVDTATFDPADYLSRTTPPSEEAITNFYNEHTTEFEISPAVAYEYVLITPEESQKSVPVSADDIELYYADNESDFATPETLKGSFIRFNYPKNATDPQKAELKERATKVLARAKAGESFEALAREFSDDNPTKTRGGDLGWVSRGKMSKEFDDAAFGLKGPGVAELIETSAGLQIAKVFEYKAAGTTPLNEVKGKITEILQKREAPVYAANHAQELFEQWQKSALSLADFAKERKLTVVPTNGLLTKDMDPESRAAGLTAAVLPLATEPRQLADVDDKVALVQVVKSREADIAPLADVRDKVVQRLKAIEAKDLARKDAARIVDEFSKGSYKTISEAAAKEKFKKDSFAKVDRTKLEGVFLDKEISRLVFSERAIGQKPARVFEKNGKFILVQVISRSLPREADVEEKLAASKPIEDSRVAGTLVESLVNQLKAAAIVEISPQILASTEAIVE